MKKLLFLSLLPVIMIACNSSGDKTSENKDTTNHDMHMPSTPVEMPPMAEVPAGAKVYFANLKNGQTVTSPFKVEMAVSGLSVDTANGHLKPASGHHHILIDMDSVDD